MMDENSGVIDLIQLLKDMLEVRACAMALAISEQDAALAAAVNNGIDSEIHRLVVAHQARLSAECEEFSAKIDGFIDTVGFISFAYIHLDGDPSSTKTQVNTAQAAMEARENLAMVTLMADLAGTIVEREKGLHPMLFEQTTPELIEHLTREREKEMAGTVTSS